MDTNGDFVHIRIGLAQRVVEFRYRADAVRIVGQAEGDAFPFLRRVGAFGGRVAGSGSVAFAGRRFAFVRLADVDTRPNRTPRTQQTRQHRKEEHDVRGRQQSAGDHATAEPNLHGARRP